MAILRDGLASAGPPCGWLVAAPREKIKETVSPAPGLDYWTPLPGMVAWESGDTRARAPMVGWVTTPWVKNPGRQ